MIKTICVLIFLFVLTEALLPKHHGRMKDHTNRRFNLGKHTLRNFKKDGFMPWPRAHAQMGNNKLNKEIFSMTKEELQNHPLYLRFRGDCSTTCPEHQMCLGRRRSKCVPLKVMRMFLKRKMHHKKFGRRHGKGFHGNKMRKEHVDRIRQRMDSSKKEHLHNHELLADLRNKKLAHISKKQQKEENENQLMDETQNIGELITRSGYVPDEQSSSCASGDLETIHQALRRWFVPIISRFERKNEHGNHMNQGHGRVKRMHKFHRRQRRNNHLGVAMHHQHMKGCHCGKRAAPIHHKFGEVDMSLTSSLMVPLLENGQRACIQDYMLKCDKDNSKSISKHEYCCCFQENHNTNEGGMLTSEIGRIHI